MSLVAESESEVIDQFRNIMAPYLGIAIPGFRDSGIPGSRKFSNPEISGLSRTQSRDFGINKMYLFNGLFSTF